MSDHIGARGIGATFNGKSLGWFATREEADEAMAVAVAADKQERARRKSLPEALIEAIMPHMQDVWPGDESNVSDDERRELATACALDVYAVLVEAGLQ